jgi:hypothetical protein
VVLDLAAAGGRFSEIGIAGRTLAERAGVAEGTGGKALRTLVSAGVLRKLPTGPRETCVYSIVRSHRVFKGAAPTHHTRADGAADGWRWGALGGTAMAIWQVLDTDTPTSSKQVQELLGGGLRWKQQKLADMAAYALVASVGDDGWIRCHADDAPALLEAAAHDHGTFEKGAKQVERGIEQRQKFEEWKVKQEAKKHDTKQDHAEERAAHLAKVELMDDAERAAKEAEVVAPGIEPETGLNIAKQEAADLAEAA